MRACKLLLTVAAMAVTPMEGRGQWCNDCQDDDVAIRHISPSSPFIEIGWYGPTHTDWYSGWCLFFHEAGCSNVEHTDYAEMKLPRDSDEWGPWVDSMKDRGFVYNADRHALQASSCDGMMVVANIPLPPLYDPIGVGRRQSTSVVLGNGSGRQDAPAGRGGSAPRLQW